MEDIKKLQEEFNALQKEYKTLRDEFDKKSPNELTDVYLNALLGKIKPLEGKYSTLESNLTAEPLKKELEYHIEQIEMSLGKIKRGIDDSKEIEFQLKEIVKIFTEFRGLRKDLKTLESDFEDMKTDISHERKKPERTAFELAVQAAKEKKAPGFDIVQQIFKHPVPIKKKSLMEPIEVDPPRKDHQDHN